MPVSIQASQLPDHIRRQILDQVRNAAGEYTYDRMVADLGEDRVLQMALDAVVGQRAPQLERVPSVPLRAWRGVWDLYGKKWWERLIGWGCLLLGAGPLGVLFLAALVWVSCALYFVARGRGIGRGLGVVLVAGFWLTLVGIGSGALPKAGPWLLTGVRGWWGWLGSRF